MFGIELRSPVSSHRPSVEIQFSTCPHLAPSDEL